MGCRWVLIWSRSLSISGSCSCWCRKQLQSFSNNCGDSSWFSCGMLNLCFFCWVNIFHLVSDGIKMLMWELQWKLKAKWVLLNLVILLSWINSSIKAVKCDPWWPVLQAFRRNFYYFPWSIKKYWGWKVIYYKFTLNYFHNLFICILQYRLCVHWGFIVHKRYQIWHAVASTEGI